MVAQCDKRARIVYMGNPEFAVAPLQALRGAGYDIAAVVSSPARPAGRGRKLRETEVAQCAREMGALLLQPENLGEESFIALLRSLNLDLGVVVAFRMLPRAVWSVPRLGMINLHTSLLPVYRGAAPVNWAIMNGETESGVTTFLLDEGMDSGKILMRAGTAITERDTSGTLHARLSVLGAKLVVETVEELLQGGLQPSVQPTAEGLPSAPKLFKADCRVDWARSAVEVDRKIRGLSPLPTAWSDMEMDGVRVEHVKLYLSSRGGMCREGAAGETGSVRIMGKGEGIAVLCGDGAEVSIESLQLPGRKQLTVADFLRGCGGTALRFV